MKYWSYWKTKNKVLFIVIMSLLTLFLIFKIILPIIKWNMSYDVSNIDTPEKAIEYYFDAINETNPKKEMAVYPHRKIDSESMFKYTFSTLLWCKLKSIEHISDDTYFVTYDSGFLFGMPIQSGELSREVMYLNVGKDAKSDNYYIYGIWYNDY